MNPLHLKLGDVHKNMVDSVIQGTQRTMKLTIEKAREIRNGWKKQRGYRIAMATKYGVSEVTISYVLLHRIWKESDYCGS